MKPIILPGGTNLELSEWRVRVEKDIKLLEELNHDLSRWRECIWALDQMIRKLESRKYFAAECDKMNGIAKKLAIGRSKRLWLVTKL
jgi:hypothetical protein